MRSSFAPSCALFWKADRRKLSFDWLTAHWFIFLPLRQGRPYALTSIYIWSACNSICDPLEPPKTEETEERSSPTLVCLAECKYSANTVGHMADFKVQGKFQAAPRPLSDGGAEGQRSCSQSSVTLACIFVLQLKKKQKLCASCVLVFHLCTLCECFCHDICRLAFALLRVCVCVRMCRCVLYLVQGAFLHSDVSQQGDWPNPDN